MPFCGKCGARVEDNEQCPRCGELCTPFHPGGGLEVDYEAAAAPKVQGIAGKRPTAAQIGADGGAAEMLSAADDEPWGKLEAPPPKPSLSFDEREHTNRMLVWRVTRVPVLLILGWFTFSHLFLGSTWVFVDNVNILIHEAGHAAFSWDGQTLHALGGTLGQLLMPAAFIVYFSWWRNERFAGLACVWWLGENFVPIAVYMKDASTRELPLLGGGTHDWAFLFGNWGLLHRARDIGGYFQWLGVVIMVGTLLLLSWWTIRPTSRELAPPPE